LAQSRHLIAAGRSVAAVRAEEMTLVMTDESGFDELADDAWAGDELEHAYRQALEAMEAVEHTIGPAEAASATDDGSPVSEDVVDVQMPSEQGSDQSPPTDNGSSPSSESSPVLTEVPLTTDAKPFAGAALHETALPVSPRVVPIADESSGAAASRIEARQVIEAALFVGGGPLTTKKLSSLLSGSFDDASVEEQIESLNLQYAGEARPYEIRLGEGGYRLVLRSEFERIRNRVHGFGPKEVRLSQDALEVLALVAYKQPITKSQIENVGKSNPGGVLRQLLRRELIALERTENSKDVSYRTTSRFLQLFGLSRIDELPQADELNLK
jgi:segregation and condensation protein B